MWLYYQVRSGWVVSNSPSKVWHFYSIWHTVLRLIRSSGSNLMLTINVGLLIRWGTAGGLSARCAVYVRVTSADLSQAARCPVCWRRQVTLAGCCQITCKAAVQCYSCSASSLLAAASASVCNYTGAVDSFLTIIRLCPDLHATLVSWYRLTLNHRKISNSFSLHSK